jgi:ketopantoate reductase
MKIAVIGAGAMGSIYALNNWRHSVRAVAWFSLKLMRE